MFDGFSPGEFSGVRTRIFGSPAREGSFPSPLNRSRSSFSGTFTDQKSDFVYNHVINTYEMAG